MHRHSSSLLTWLAAACTAGLGAIFNAAAFARQAPEHGQAPSRRTGKARATSSLPSNAAMLKRMAKRRRNIRAKASKRKAHR